MAFQREALPCDFMYLSDDHESIRIDFVDQRIDGRQFALLDDAKRRLLLDPFKSRLDVHHRQADILHKQQRLFDFRIFFRNDEKLHLIRACDHHFVDHDGRQEHHDQPVKDLFHAREGCLGQQENDVERIHPHRNRYAEMLVQQQRRNVHPTRGGADLENQPHSQSAQNARIDGRQQNIIGDVLQRRQRPEKRQERRENKRAQDRRQSELPAQQSRTDEKHEAVENQHDQGNVQTEKMIQNNGKSRCSPGDQIFGKMNAAIAKATMIFPARTAAIGFKVWIIIKSFTPLSKMYNGADTYRKKISPPL